MARLAEETMGACPVDGGTVQPPDVPPPAGPSTAALEAVRLELARWLLIPGTDRLTCPVNLPEQANSMRHWVAARIAWWLLDGDREIAQRIADDENLGREALGQTLVDLAELEATVMDGIGW